MRTSRKTCTGLRGAAALVAAVLVLLIAPGAASAFIYWASYGKASAGSTLGRIGNDRSGYTPAFVTGAHAPCGVAVNASHIYWANFGTGTGFTGSISRTTLAGSSRQDLVPDIVAPCGVALTSTHVYWAGAQAIGRARLDGSEVDRTFVPRPPGGKLVLGVAITGDHLYYAYTGGDNRVKVGWAHLAGSGRNPELIDVGPGQSGGVAATSQNVFVARNEGGTGSVVRAFVDGGTLLSVEPPIVTTPVTLCGLAVHGSHVYWGNNKAGEGTTIGRVGVEGSGADHAFIQGTGGPCGIAVDDLSAPAAPGPAAATAEATDITATSARLRGAVNPNGSNTVYRFEWGTSTAYGNQIPLTDQGIGADGAYHDVFADLDGLRQRTTYHYRIVAFNGEGTSYGLDQTFSTAAIPFPQNTQSPTATASGPLIPGTTLTCAPGAWANDVDSFEFLWTVGNTIDQGHPDFGKPRPASASERSVFTLDGQHANYTVYCTVVARGEGGDNRAISNVVVPRCREVTIAGRIIRSLEQGRCFEARAGGVVTFNGEFSINGLKFKGGTATFNDKAKNVSFSSSAQVTAGSQILTRIKHGLNLADGDFDLFAEHALPGLTLFGMPIASSADVTARFKGTKTVVGLKVAPKLMWVGSSPAHGDVHFEGDDNGFHFHGLHVSIDHASLGAPGSPLTLEHVEFEYNSDGAGKDACGQPYSGRFWKLKVGELKFPWNLPVKITKPGVTIVNGGLRDLTGGFSGASIPAGPGLLIHGIGANLCLNPFGIGGEIDASYAKFLKLHGTVLFRPDPYEFTAKVDGTFDTGVPLVEKIPVGDAKLTFDRSGGFGFEGQIHARASSFASMHGRVRGSAAPSGDFMFGAGIEVCVGYCVGAEGIVSSRGAAACGVVKLVKELKILGRTVFPEIAGHMRFGVLYRDGVDFGIGLGSNCHFGPYQVAVAAAAQTGGATVNLPQAVKALHLEITGTPGTRAYTVTGPAGRTIDTALDEAQLDQQGARVIQVGEDLTYVTIASAAAGSWTVTAQPGSAVRRVEPEVPQPTPVIDAGVTSGRDARGAVASAAHAKKRVLRYDLRIPAGGEVRFVEHGDHIVRPLKLVRAPVDRSRRLVAPLRRLRGTVTFSPTLSRDPARTIEAELGRSGQVWSRRVVARFRAPRWAVPTRPAAVRAARRGTRVIVTWRPVSSARDYEVMGRAADGANTATIVRGTRARLDLPAGHGAIVAVRARRADGLLGPFATARLAPPASAAALRSVRLSRRTFGARTRPAPAIVVALRRPATVRFAVLRGRRTVATFTRLLPGGTTRVPFGTRVGKRRLGPGAYVLRAVATDQTNGRSRARATFRIGR